MKTARMIGNYAEHRAAELGISKEAINDVLQFSDQETSAFFKGRLLLSFDQIESLAKALKISIQELINGDEKEYSKSVVHCMNAFDNNANREKILDIIDDYLDVWDSLQLRK